MGLVGSRGCGPRHTQIAVQEFRENNPGEGVYMGSAWLGRGQSGGLGVVAEKENILNAEHLSAVRDR
jgi:hypothetical protein